MGGGVVIRSTAEWLIVLFVVFALLFETLLHKLEHWVKEKQPNLQSVLRNLYRELMILGVISFAFIMYVFIGSPSDSVKLTFETAHVWLFMFACFHTAIVSATVVISLRLSKRWKFLEKMDLVRYLDSKEHYRRLSEKRNFKRNWLWKHVFWWLRDPREKLEFDNLHEIMTFHDIRYQFIHFRNLKPDFKFSKFLRKIKFATFIELVEINPLNWIILLCLIFADIIRVKIGSHPHFEAYYLMVHSVFNVLLVYFLSRKIRSIHWKMTKNPGTYYDTIDANEFREQLKLAEEQSRSNTGNKETGSSSSDSSPPASKPSVSFAETTDDAQANSRVSFTEPRGVTFATEIEESPDSSISCGFEIPDAEGDDELYEPPPLRHMGPTALNLLDKVKKGNESKDSIGHVPVSIDMSTSMPEREIKIREGAAVPTRGLFSIDIPASEEDEDDSPADNAGHDLTALGKLSKKRQKEALHRLHQRKTTNAAMSETKKNIEMAKSLSPSRQYPKWVVKIFPRLGRVASVTEKLFWFGSHRFYLFCVENALFYTNVNISTCIAKLSFLSKEIADYNKSKAALAKSAKFEILESVRAAAEASKGEKNLKKPTESMTLLTIALVLSVLALGFVLFHIATIMKKYIFVLNNAGLLREDMMIETIENVNINNATGRGGDKEEEQPLASYDSDSGDDNEDDPTDFGALRRKVTTFIAREQSGGV